MMGAIGELLSDIREGFQNGKKFYRAKLQIFLDRPLKDRVHTNHPTLDRITGYVVYERVHRACMFCGTVGHDMGNCKTRARLARLRYEAPYKDMTEMAGILEPMLHRCLTH
jgi:Zinc knuckle